MTRLAKALRRRLWGQARGLGYRIRASLAPRARPERFLLVACFERGWLGNVRQSAEAIQRHSRHRFDMLNLSGLTLRGGPRIPRYVRLADYRGVLLHSSLPYPPAILAALDAGRRETLASYQGLKIVMKQDEHYRPAEFAAWLRRIGADLLATCVPPDQVRLVYPRCVLPALCFLHVRTGYVTPQMRRCNFPPSAQRPIDVGYRSSEAPFVFGRLCHEKHQIGRLFARICAERGLAADISSRWNDRLYGRAWWRFLGRSKATLGTESGGSVFDFDGTLERQCAAYLKNHPAADFETVHQLFLAPHEGRIRYAQVSPRHFEAAACRTLQILYEGQYSGIFQPWRHYLPLKRDLGNLEEVLACFRDPRRRQQITEAAFDEIIMNDAHLASAMVTELDDAIDQLLAGWRGQSPAATPAAMRVVPAPHIVIGRLVGVRGRAGRRQTVLEAPREAVCR